MRILYLSSVFKTGFGVGLVISKQVEGLIKAGYTDVIVATPDFSTDMVQGNFKCIEVGIEYESVQKVMNELKPDVTIVHTPPFFSHIAKFDDFSTIKIAYDHGEPFPSFFPDEERIPREMMDDNKYRAISKFDVHISISEFIKKCSRIPDSIIIYNGTEHLTSEASGEIDIRKKLGLNKNAFIISTLSRIGVGESYYKGFDVLEAVKKEYTRRTGHNDDVVFFVMGRSVPKGNPAEKKLRDSGFLVITDVDEIFKREALLQSDVFLSPSLWEGFNLPLIEAQYLGVPSMAFSEGAHPEVCPFHFRNIGEAVNHIRFLRGNNEFLEKYGNACKDYVRRKFRWEDNISKIVSVLESRTFSNI